MHFNPGKRFANALISGLRRCLLLWILTGCTLAVFGQAYSFRRYGPESGLSEGFIYSISQVDQGFLWLGTGGGLVRFDGKSFKKFTIKDGLAEDFVTKIIPGRNGALWAGHFQGGISYFDGQSFRPIPLSKPTSSSITGLVQDKSGNIWFSSQRDGLIRVDSSLQATQFDADLGNTLCFSLVDGPDGNLYLATESGLWVYSIDPKNRAPVLLRKEAKIPAEKISLLVHSRKKDGFWIGTESGRFFRMRIGPKNGGVFVKELKGLNPSKTGAVVSALEDTRGDVWIGTEWGGLQKYRPTLGDTALVEVPQIQEMDSLNKDAIRCLYEDRFGQIWVGTFGAGVLCLSEQNTSLRIPAHSTNPSVHAILEDQSGNFWLGTETGLSYYQRATLLGGFPSFSLSNQIPLPNGRLYGAKEGLPPESPTALSQTRDGSIWVGFHGKGLFRKKPGEEKFKKIPLGPDALCEFVSDIEDLENQRLWVGTQAGAMELDLEGNVVRALTSMEGLPHNHISDLQAGKNATLFLLSRTNRLVQVDGENLTMLIVSENGEVPQLSCMTIGPAGELWLGTEGNGVYRFDGEKFLHLGTAQGLYSNYVYKVLVEPNGRLWAIHRGGISLLNPGSKRFISKDFGASFRFEETFIFNTLVDRAGNVWVGTGQGVIWKPKDQNAQAMSAPPVYLTDLLVNDKPYPVNQTLALPYGTYRLRFEFYGLSFINQDQVRYRFKLSGNDSEWSEPDGENTATYQGLKDGDYVFQVEASNSEGVWSQTPASISIRIVSPFWKKLWFFLVVIGGVSLLFYLFLQYRFYQLNREKAELEHKIAEATLELKEEKEKLEAAYLEVEKLSIVASETDNAVYLVTQKGELEWVNNAFTELSGYTTEDLRKMVAPGQHFLSISSNPFIMEYLEKVVREKKSVTYESLLPNKFGREIWTLSTLTPILDDKGRLRKVVVIDSNITERKEAERKIQQLNQELEKLVDERTEELHRTNDRLFQENQEHIRTAQRLREINQELDTFVYKASHDLKGPLASLLGLMDIVGRETQDPTTHQYLPLMERSARRLDSILLDLLEATKIKHSKLEFSEIHLHGLLEGILKSLEHRSDFQTLKAKLSIPPDFILRSDPQLLRSILQNLVDNAVKYQDIRKTEPWVAVSAHTSEEGTWISVRDNGIGIPSHLQGKVFEMFFRGTQRSKGSGLGLYIVKNALERLSGRLEMESKEGEGSEFRIFLPSIPLHTEE